MNKAKLIPLAEVALDKARKAFTEADEAYRAADASFRLVIKHEEEARTTFHDATRHFSALSSAYLEETPEARQAFDFMNAAGRAYAHAMELMKLERHEWMKAVESRAQAEKMVNQALVSYADLHEVT